MTRMQIQLPDELYRRLKEIAEQKGWSLAEVVQKAGEQFVSLFPEEPQTKVTWRFPTLDCGGDFLTDPASLRPEAYAILQRYGS
jgi:hypothetical protein